MLLVQGPEIILKVIGGNPVSEGPCEAEKGDSACYLLLQMPQDCNMIIKSS